MALWNNNIVINFLLTITMCLSTLTAICQNPDYLQEKRYNNIEGNSLYIIHDGKSVQYWEDFTTVAKKWQDAKFAGRFDSVHSVQDEYYFGIADYKILFDKAYFFFIEGKLTYFRIASNEFQLMLYPGGQKKESVLFTIGSSIESVNKLSTRFSKTFLNRHASKKEGYNLVFNLGEYSEAAYFNDLVVTTNASGVITGFIYYGHF